MTEEEAKTKWCPMARLVAGQETDEYGVTLVPDNQVSFNRMAYTKETKLPAGAYCVASDCMMWRWYNDGGRDQGYCGLGGK